MSEKSAYYFVLQLQANSEINSSSPTCTILRGRVYCIRLSIVNDPEMKYSESIQRHERTTGRCSCN